MTGGKSSKMLMDFDDLLVNAYQLLKSDDMVRQKYREIFRHLLVDEFQCDMSSHSLSVTKVTKVAVNTLCIPILSTSSNGLEDPEREWGV